MRVAGIPIAVVVGVYVLATYFWQASNSMAPTQILFACGLGCCAWAAYRARREGFSLRVALLMAVIVSIGHFVTRNWLLAASVDQPFVGSPLMQLAGFGILYTLPLTIGAAWLATKFARRPVEQ